MNRDIFPKSNNRLSTKDLTFMCEGTFLGSVQGQSGFGSGRVEGCSAPEALFGGEHHSSRA